MLVYFKHITIALIEVAHHACILNNYLSILAIMPMNKSLHNDICVAWENMSYLALYRPTLFLSTHILFVAPAVHEVTLYNTKSVD